jgi:hypothetical protein
MTAVLAAHQANSQYRHGFDSAAITWVKQVPGAPGVRDHCTSAVYPIMYAVAADDSTPAGRADGGYLKPVWKKSWS